MKLFPRLFALALLGVLLSSCLHSAPEPPPPTSRKYILTQGVKYKDVWVAVVRGMTKSLNILEINQSEGFIKGDLADWGFREYLTVSVKPDPSAPEAFRVDVASTRSRSVVMRDWQEDMLQDLRGLLQKAPGGSEVNVRVLEESLP
ncbi:MAG: hypothetical protein V1806_11600 [Pseudomonadota bacterium]